MEVNSLIQQCKKEMEQAESSAIAADVLRRPNRPLLLVFLGNHKEYERDVKQTLDMNWPTATTSIEYRTYETSEAFERAFEEDEQGNIEMEDLVIDLCDYNRDFQTKNNVIIGYFINSNDCAEEYIRILDSDFSPAAGGLITRFVFFMSKFTRNNDRKQSMAALRKLDELSRNPDSKKYWDNTHVVSISDFLRGGAVVPQDEYHDSYAFATELLLLYNSVSNNNAMISWLPSLTDDAGNFITGAFKRKGKPRGQIIKTVLYQYLERCHSMITVQEDEDETLKDHTEDILNVCSGLIIELFNKKVRPLLPEEMDLRGIPNGVQSIKEAGEDDYPDKTNGVWKAYKKLYYQGAVRTAFPAQDDLVEAFEDKLSDVYNCAQIKAQFANVLERLQRDSFIKGYVPQNQSLHECGLQAASQAMIDYAIPALIKAVQNLLNGAKVYEECISHAKQMLYPTDTDIKNYYLKEVNVFIDKLDGQDRVKRDMRRPCDEKILMSRLQTVFKKILHEPGSKLQMSFDKELAARTDIQTAEKVIASVLQVSYQEMENNIRMPLTNATSIGDFSLVNPKTGYAKHGAGISNIFQVSRMDCLDRVAFFSFDINNVIG